MLVSFSNVLVDAGSRALTATPRALGTDGNTVLAIMQGVAGYEVTEVPLADFSVAQPGEPVDPAGLAYTSDEFEYDEADGIIYLLSKLHVSIFRWSVTEQRYLTSIPLTVVPKFLSLDADADVIYLADDDGKIKKLPLYSLVESHIATLSQTPRGPARSSSAPGLRPWVRCRRFS